LRQELEALDLYLGTERLRFAERLRLEYAIEDSALNALVPSLLLQPLLENSLKYAVSSREQGGLVRIEGRTREGWLELSVIDDGPGLRDGTPVSERRGVGLRNTSERLAVLYGNNARFAVSNSNPGLRVDMQLPLELAEAGPESVVNRVAPAPAARGARA
jgi:two-component system, LytTR family, sensor kinase